MKKHLILSMMAVLCLTGCGQSSGGGDGEITLKTPTCLSMMSSNCQKYVDDMRAQQQRLIEDNSEDYDYYLNDLNGEAGVDLTKGVAPCTGDSGTDGGYRDGSVENAYLDNVAAEWEKGEKSDENKGVEISFDVAESLQGKEYTIAYSVNKNLKDAKTITVDETTARLKNLFVNQQYYYQVSVDGKKSEVGSFKTGDYPRWIDARPMFNVRDAGGYTVKDGDTLKRIKQGMVYRGGEITAQENWKSGQQYRGDTGGRYVNSSNMMQDGHIQTYRSSYRYDDDRENNPARVAFREDMGMVGGVEIDLRSGSERNGYPAVNNYCDFADETNPDIGYVLKSISSYDNGMKNNKALIKEVFEDYLANADQKPVYYHCYGGADRTGTIGFLLGAVLGMSYTDLVIDFELTSYSSNPSRNYRSHLRNGPYNYWPRMVNYLKNTLHWGSEKTIRQSAEEFLVNDCGIAQEKIAKIRQIMLEPIE